MVVKIPGVNKWLDINRIQAIDYHPDKDERPYIVLLEYDYHLRLTGKEYTNLLKILPGAEMELVEFNSESQQVSD